MTRESCVIHFMDGTSQSFTFEVNADDSFSVANEIHRFVDQSVLAFEIDGKLQFFPVANIKSIEVSPAPKDLPLNVLHGAKIDKS